MSRSETLDLLDVLQSHLGSTRAKCDESGKSLWDRIEAIKDQQTMAIGYAASLETVLMEIMNGNRRADRIPMEPMVRLIGFVRTGYIRNAKIESKE
jgi:hypothetical protein